MSNSLFIDPFCLNNIYIYIYIYIFYCEVRNILKKGLKLKITKRLKILEDSQPSKIQHTDCKKAKEKLEKLGKVTISLRLTPT